MGAFIIGGLFFLATLAFCLLFSMAYGMSDAPSYRESPMPYLITGSIISALIIASHWMPHIGW